MDSDESESSKSDSMSGKIPLKANDIPTEKNMNTKDTNPMNRDHLRVIFTTVFDGFIVINASVVHNHTSAKTEVCSNQAEISHISDSKEKMNAMISVNKCQKKPRDNPQDGKCSVSSS